MKKQIKNLTSNQKSFISIMDKLVGRYSRWEIWKDFIAMSATAISNACPGGFSPEREEMYHKCADRYSSAELGCFAQMLGLTFTAYQEDTNQDFLGNLFMSLNIADKWKGQFFTPFHLCQLMANLEAGPTFAEDHEARGLSSIYDPACGAGALLLAFASICEEAGVDYCRSVIFVGQDLDLLAGMMCYIQLSARNCPGYVKIGDSLSDPVIGQSENPLLPDHDSSIWETPIFQSEIWLPRRLAAKYQNA